MKKNNKEIKENNLKNIDFKDKKMIILYICLGLFIILTITVLTKIISPIDSYMESLVIGIRNDKLTVIMTNITNIARAYSLIAISILLLFIIRDKKIPLSIIINLVAVFLTSQVFKFIFRRPRPDILALVRATGYSYPSGHTMVSTAYFVFITYLLCKKMKNKLNKTFLIIISVIMLLLIGFSRIYLGVHYLSDVIGGFLLGIAYLMIYIKVIDKEDDKK